MSLRCLAGESLNFDEVDPMLHNPIGVGACKRCRAVHFVNAGIAYVCTNIRDGLHPRTHPLFQEWDPESAEPGEKWVAGACSDRDGRLYDTPESRTCEAHFKHVPHRKFCCAVMYNAINERKTK